MLDPLILKAISVGFGLLFLLAAVHKLTAAQHFRTILQEYRLLPDAIVTLVARIIPLLEILLGAGWLLLDQAVAIALASALLLALYTAAIGINLFRGRIHIGCGCGVAGTDKNDQQLSTGLVVRNLLLIAISLAATIPAISRDLGAVDYVTLIATVPAGVLLYLASNQLLSNSAAIGAWRNSDD